eukprot:475150_1
MFKFTTMHICIFTWLSFLICEGTYTLVSAHLYFEVVHHKRNHSGYAYGLQTATTATMSQLKTQYYPDHPESQHFEGAVHLIKAENLFKSIGITKEFSSINETKLAVKKKIIEYPVSFLDGYRQSTKYPISSETVKLEAYDPVGRYKHVYKVSVSYYYEADDEEDEEERRRLAINASDAVYNNFYLLAVFVIVLFIVTALYLLV